MSAVMNKAALDAWRQTGETARAWLQERDRANGTTFVDERLEQMHRRMLRNHGISPDARPFTAPHKR